MRGALIAVLFVTPAFAQDPEAPPFDASLIDACLEQASQDAQPDYAACIGAASGPCMNSPEGSSTAGMSYCLGRELDVWDARLNDSYARVIEAARATDAEMTRMGSAAEQQEPLFRQMQRDWITFRDSACEYERSRWGGGTGGGPASLSCSLELTARQYLRLRAYEPGNE